MAFFALISKPVITNSGRNKLNKENENVNETGKLYRLDERAGIDLKVIRTMMEQAVQVVPMPGWGIIAVGFIGLLAAFFTRNLQEMNWVAGWAVSAVTAVILALLISSWHIRTTGKSIYVGGVTRFWLSLLPGFVSAGALTWLFIQINQIAYLPALWLLLYGVSVTAAASHSIPLVRWMGIGFLILGTVSVFAPSSNLAMGLGFGGLHLVFGFLITRASHD